MKKAIENPLVLSGRKFSIKDLISIQETVKLFPNLSPSELALTIAEHFSWQTPSGSLKIASSLKALEKMEKLDLITLPSKKPKAKSVQKVIEWSLKTANQNDITFTLDQLGPIELRIVKEKENHELWNEYVSRYHYLGYKRPFGAHLKYFIISKTNQEEQILGCILFSSSAWALSGRDKWIDWDTTEKGKNLNLILNNSRFLIFPWVKIKNMASKVLSIIENQIQNDWQEVYNYKPVLIETFVDSSKYEGICYKAANWTSLGETTGKGRNSTTGSAEKSIKYVFAKPLDLNFRYILKNQKIPERKKDKIIKDEKFATIWHEIIHVISEVAIEFDQAWQKRSRVINSMLLILLIFRLIFSKNKQGYNSTISELWENCKKLNIPLPQEKPIAASSFSVAREKLDEDIFKKLNNKIINLYQNNSDSQYLWLGHRIFAVDGSKINVPRELLANGYPLPSDNSHYPQGLLSCLYQLKTKIPYDFEFTSDANERTSALKHLEALNENDIVIYDRGYFSYAMLYRHVELKVHPIFRLPANSFKEIESFRISDQLDTIITLDPTGDTKKDILKKYPLIKCIPIKVRLIKYTINNTIYCLGTTLFDEKYEIANFSDAYHSRWGIEELYKVSKSFIEIEDFHGKTERGVKQEIFAHFTLITMNRIFSNEATENLSKIFKGKHDVSENESASSVRVNFKNCLTTFARRIEEVFLLPAIHVNNVVKEMLNSVTRYYQKLRSSRSYARKSMKPVNKWRSKKVESGFQTA
jgi:hypothetical protein